MFQIGLLRLRNQEAKSELQNQLQQVQKLEAIGVLAGGIAHDFNNILHPVMGFATMGLRRTTDDPVLHSYFTAILKASSRARELVRQILTFSRRDKVELAPNRLQPILKESLKMMRASLPVTIKMTWNIDEDCGLVLCDPTRIQQVIVNLITNAFHGMQEKVGELTVDLQSRLAPEDDGVGSGMKTRRFVCLRVADSGVGMTEETLKKIFDPYFTTKQPGEGTGLGLSVVMGIVKSYGGTIDVTSTLGEGSVFAVCFPETGVRMVGVGMRRTDSGG